MSMSCLLETNAVTDIYVTATRIDPTSAEFVNEQPIIMAKPPLETHKKVYPSHGNVERGLDWKVELSEKFRLCPNKKI